MLKKGPSHVLTHVMASSDKLRHKTTIPDALFVDRHENVRAARVQSGFGVYFLFENRFTESTISGLCHWKFLARNVNLASLGLSTWKYGHPITAT